MPRGLGVDLPRCHCEKMPSEPQPGYIYLLINYSMPGLIKVGRTTRAPALRVDELSAPTGIPTPFVLVYDVLVPDAPRAENEIHRILASRFRRLADKREHFEAPIHETVKLMISIRETQESSTIPDRFPASDPILELLDSRDTPPGEAGLREVLQLRERVSSPNGAEEVTVAELVEASRGEGGVVGREQARKALALLGIRVDLRSGKEVLLLATTSARLTEVLTNATGFGKPHTSLRELEGVCSSKVVRFHRDLTSRTTEVPLDLLRNLGLLSSSANAAGE